MVENNQELEYIITEKRLQQEVGWGRIPNSVAQEFRSRPYSPAPSDDDLVWMTPEEEEKRIRQSEQGIVLQNHVFDVLVCPSPPPENKPCKYVHTCVVNHLKKSAHGLAGELCFSMQEIRRKRESLRAGGERE